MSPPKKTKVKECQCPCAAPPRKRRRQPVYAPRSQPQFYAALPIPQTQFDGETVRRIVQDEFKRYHTPRKIISVAGVETQTDFEDAPPDEVSERSFGMTSALEDVRKEGSAFGVRRGEQIAIELEREAELLQERIQEQLDIARRRAEVAEMERARAAFNPTPSMSQSEEEEEPMTRGRYGLGPRRREIMREVLIGGVEARQQG